MAVHKVKRPLPQAQPERQSSNLQPVELMPVKAHVYRAIAELNTGFEKVVQDLQTLQRISFFPAERMLALHDLVCRVRAQANRECIMTLHDREMTNAGYFDRLCNQREAENGERAAR